MKFKEKEFKLYETRVREWHTIETNKDGIKKTIRINPRRISVIEYTENEFIILMDNGTEYCLETKDPYLLYLSILIGDCPNWSLDEHFRAIINAIHGINC